MAAGSRDISLASVLNVRDLGGLTTSAGHRIRNRRLLRGAAPDRISSADLSLLTLQIGLSAFLDLREANRTNIAVDSALGTSDIKRVNTPIGEVDHPSNPLVSMLAGRPFDLIAQALHFLEDEETISEAMRLIGDDSEGAVYVHCTQGKDRTGVIIGLVLSAIGVGADEIASDYAESGRTVEAMSQHLKAINDGYRKLAEDTDPQIFRTWMETPQSNMYEVLEAIETVHGSARNYLLNLPKGSQIVENLERKLLV
jgi:protein-tyrosine phosphatase